jgi:hypothetical protein
MTHFSYPRLSSDEATQLMLELLDVAPELRVEHAKAYRGHATKSPTATSLADDAHLAAVRERVVAHARSHGFGVTDRATPGYDRELPGLLGETLNMSAVEAARVDVWNYLTLVVLPDVALWRWPNAKREPAYERLLGKPRNAFRRHWRRQQLFGADLAQNLLEDEHVQLAERPGTLGSDPVVSRVAAATFIQAVDRWRLVKGDRVASLDREDLMRRFAKACTRYGAVVSLSSLPEGELRGQLAELLQKCALALARAAQGELQLEPLWDNTDESPTVDPPRAQEDPSVVEREFNQLMLRVLERAESVRWPDSLMLKQLIRDFGGVGAATRLLGDGESTWESDVAVGGLSELRLTPHVLEERFAFLFPQTLLDALRPPRTTNGREQEQAVGGGAPRLERQFAMRLEAQLKEVEKNGIKPRVFRSRVEADGAVRVCRDMATSHAPSTMFMLLWQRDRLDLTVEQLMLEPEFAPLWDLPVRMALESRLHAYQDPAL